MQEAGAANFFLLDDSRLVTRPADDAILHGITRSSLLELAGTLGYETQERRITVAEALAWSRKAEAALSGTAAILAPIGILVHGGSEHPVGGSGNSARRLRHALSDIHYGEREDRFGWLSAV